MKLTFYRDPCLLLEAMELLYSYMAQESVDRLVGKGEFCIPHGEVLRIRNEVCSSIDLEDKELQFYFHGVPLENGMGKRNFCLASAILYTPLTAACSDVDEQAEMLSRQWASVKRPYVINTINSFGLSIGTAKTDEFRPFSVEVAKLPLPAASQAQLVDVFTDYDFHLNRLVELVRPLSVRLAPLLAPWVERAQPLVQHWVEHLNGEDPLEFLKDRGYVGIKTCERMNVALRYFPAETSYLLTRRNDQDLCMMMGIAMNVGGHAERPPEKLADWEMHALRQLANPDRVAMLQAMMKQPMSGADIVQELGLHSGTVFRDLNNLGRAMLVDREVFEGKSVYRTNYSRLRKLTERVLQVIGPEEQ